ncbi:exo-1,4-beta-glucosidase [Alteromonadaceae bacterium Bs31]|nr:exo-1,4-beta-glucosidase [Alteromonadaceae bacterium Bs31]
MLEQIKRLSLGLIPLCVLFLSGCDQQPAATPQPVEKTASQDAALEQWPLAKSPELASHTEVEARVQQLLGKMSLEEKVGQMMQAEIQSLQPGDIKKYHLGSVLNGGGSMPYRKSDASAEDWLRLADSFYEESMDSSDGSVAIPIIWGTDAVHGHNNLIGATIFPHNIGLGAANNTALIRRIGELTALEVRATGVEWVFAPTLAVAQNDLWGRTYESYSENPALVAEYSAAMVEGLQGTVGQDNFLDEYHVVATAKHFLADGATLAGDDQGDARISEEELVNFHNPGYPVAINHGVQSLMASFSSWNGEKMHGSKQLLTHKLRGRMGFDGLVVGDWNGHGQLPGCTNDSCAQSINAGIDLIMVPYDWRAMYANTLAQVRSGEISEARIDQAVGRILRVKIRAGLFDKKPSERAGALDTSVVGSKAHREVARQAVRESLVLLKNHNKILPLKPQQHILLTGNAANSIPNQSGGWSVTWQGTGNTNDSFPGATSIYSGIKNAAEASGGSVELSADGSYQQKPDVAIVVFGETPYAEGHGDLNTLEFEPRHKSSLKLMQKLSEQGIPIVAVFISGRPMWVNPEMNQSAAFVAAWLPGSEGQGIADLILAKPDGSVNHDFKGTLSFSWPNTPLQAKLNPHHENYKPLFALGYGLNYTSELEGPLSLLVKVEGVDSGEVGDIDFYVGRTIQPWNIYIHNAERDQILSGAFAKLPDNDVSIQTADKDLQEDALRFSWQETWRAELTMRGGEPLDLSGFVEQGLVSFELNVKDVARAEAGIEIVVNRSSQNERIVSLNDFAWQNNGKGWQQVSIPVSCFVYDGDDLSSVSAPFTLRAGGKGEVEIANIRFLLEGEPNTACPDYKTRSISPEKLNEYWAVGWWEDRHKETLKRIKQGNVDVLFIGDSITQGWEGDGKAVWDKYYGSRNALSLGYGGDRTENVLWRLNHGEVDGISPKVAVLMIGTNNTGHRMEKPEFVANGIRKILDALAEKLPDTKILLLAIFPRGEMPDDPARVNNIAINTLIKDFADNKTVYYLDINEHFLGEGGKLSRDVMPDLLHLNAASYGVWAEKMEPTLQSLLGE